MQRLLVIDDEPGIRFSVEQVFEQAGIEVFTAGSGEEGLRVAGEKMPDVILLDIRLGRCSGLELFHELSRVDPRASIIFITGHGTADAACEARTLGAYEYLVKPLDAVQLQHVVHRALATSHSVPAPAMKPEGRRLQSRPTEG